ncbi:hypothetical protein C0J52_27814, partial [Blattella germanica]
SPAVNKKLSALNDRLDDLERIENEIKVNIDICERKIRDDEERQGSINSLMQSISKLENDLRNLNIEPERSVSKIRKEGIEAGEHVLSTPGKKIPRSEEYKFHCDYFNRTVIRNLFIEFYQVKKIVPTAPKLLKEIRNRIDFPWEVDTLRKLLHSMGFKWKKFRTSTPAQRMMRGTALQQEKITKMKKLEALQAEIYRAESELAGLRERRNKIRNDKEMEATVLTLQLCEKVVQLVTLQKEYDEINQEHKTLQLELDILLQNIDEVIRSRKNEAMRLFEIAKEQTGARSVIK